MTRVSVTPRTTPPFSFAVVHLVARDPRDRPVRVHHGDPVLHHRRVRGGEHDQPHDIRLRVGDQEIAWQQLLADGERRVDGAHGRLRKVC